jgi:hypothetical protein
MHTIQSILRTDLLITPMFPSGDVQHKFTASYNHMEYSLNAPLRLRLENDASESHLLSITVMQVCDAPYDKGPERPREPKAVHGQRQTKQAHENDRFSTHKVGHSTPMQHRHSLREEKQRFLVLHIIIMRHQPR